MTLDQAVTQTLSRLGDLANTIWSRDEISLYYKDGYDQFCRRTKCLFDTVVIENLPPTSNWQTDLEKYFIQQKSGWGHTDMPFHFTNDAASSDERGTGIDGRVGGPYSGPSGMTNPADVQYSDTITDSVPTTVYGGLLPQSTVEVIRVAWSGRNLTGISSQQMKRIDPTYEIRTGDPQFFIWDKDGIFFMRFVPAASGDATYDTISGSWGTMTQTSDTDVDVVTTEPNGHQTGGYGILVYRDHIDEADGLFPANGPWGTPTRLHPDTMNFRIEVTRLGRDLSANPVELPSAYQKYLEFYAMGKALRRDGPGQDIALADHYDSRFEMGVSRLDKKVNQMSSERIGRLGPTPKPESFMLGYPVLPYPYDSKQW